MLNKPLIIKYVILCLIIVIYGSSCLLSSSTVQEKMSNELFQLVNAKDPVKFARRHGIEIKGEDNLVKIIIKLKADIVGITDMVDRYNLQVEKKRARVIEAYLPIENLKSLAEDDRVIYIRRPRKFILW